MRKQIRYMAILLVLIALILSSTWVFQTSVRAVGSTEGCDLVNSTGYIDIHYCVDSYTGFEYYINSVGFMLPKD